MSEKTMDDCSKDVISSLPDTLLCQILSNLSTKEAALTSLLSKRWRCLFAHAPNLEFDDFSSLHPETVMPDQTSFVSFVDRVLELRGKDHVNKFSLTCGDGVRKSDVICWISKVLRRGVSELALHHNPALYYSFPSKVFRSKTLVKLKIGTEDGLSIKLRDVFLPKLKTLCLDSVALVGDETESEFAKLLSGCPVLEELILLNLTWDYWDSCSVSVTTLKRLTFCCGDLDENPKTVSFDTPNIVYLEYSDTIANKYLKVNFDSLVEASIGIRITRYQRANASNGMVGDVTNLLMGICNVKTLYLSYDTLETFASCCEAMSVFNNLTHLTIESNPEVGWGSLPDLLKNCPNLETLVFQGLLHKATDRCGDICLCQGLEKSPSSLLSCPVKFLKILKFGETDVEMEKDMIINFLKNMPNLEQVTIYYNTSVDDDFYEVSTELQILRKVASPKCKIQIVSDNISFTYPVHSFSPTSGITFFRYAFPV